MKFSVAWDSIEKENKYLKLLVALLILLSTVLAVASAVFGSKEPLLIERGCYSKVNQHQSPAPTDEEMKSFLEDAIKARFNTGFQNAALLSREQLMYREHEQEELQKQKMRQTVIFNSAEIKKDAVLVDADRMVSVGDIRSTFKFPLKIRLDRTQRSEVNPYGLVLSDAAEVTEGKSQ